MKDTEKQVDILLVEDNPNDAELTLRALNKSKLANAIVVARDGEEAIDYVFARGAYSDRPLEAKPRLVLLDLQLPKFSGLEVLKAIRADPRTSLIPVVILTTSKDGADMTESYRLGANSFIVKPVNFDKFLEAIKELGLYWLLLNEQP
jgi:CheY-like chemotaxis protein